jgi:hypothetical protein
VKEYFVFIRVLIKEIIQKNMILIRILAFLVEEKEEKVLVKVVQDIKMLFLNLYLMVKVKMKKMKMKKMKKKEEEIMDLNLLKK